MTSSARARRRWDRKVGGVGAASKSPRMDYSSVDVSRGETPESLLRYLRDEQRLRGEVELKVDALEIEMADRDEEARVALEDAAERRRRSGERVNS